MLYVDCIANGTATIAGKKQHTNVGAVRFYVLQYLIHVALKISQMIFLILGLRYNVFKGIDTRDMVQ